MLLGVVNCFQKFSIFADSNNTIGKTCKESVSCKEFKKQKNRLKPSDFFIVNSKFSMLILAMLRIKKVPIVDKVAPLGWVFGCEKSQSPQTACR